ncbi:hypothetical protein NBRGN_016_02340 [Nocardia brasiliensis NBRC 14402]|uniref:DUF350 domain-containing protein n=1 Tax=Nocardia brasiliensis (strain ATCC 700358 / HUJEG-1) TaxID=1133849 RepID=K0EWK7_NOCB7|nr:DUF350 domain-containing protein [Nocardia brasiliensis]AFU04223.1 hypothetical protein O3I_031370 [Nocardia brasiliensis ATCC 700358]ASF13586.1 DUF350 domain-containing protein [Nocardia brasiliensis]MBF6128381.1 DUF350 domain-containing protein [Nocardia brasiliensis]MBF6544629.1 DUF350 domain-containing protein [Nocardia brasiliensis]OCF91589.1 hypothetical protein AW168_06255 [Nocardia brasiliensis]
MTAVALESGYWSSLGEGVGAIILYALIGLVLMLVGFYAIDLTTPGKLRALVVEGKPNAIIVTAAGMISMAFIVVLAILAVGSGGKLSEGLIAALVFGLVGIVAQVISVRVIEKALGIDIGAALHSETYTTEVLVVAAAHFALGLVVAFAIL